MTEQELAQCFPQLHAVGFTVTSEYDESYNCIAFAAEDLERRWWWPGDSPGDYWPADVSRDESLSSFVSVFQTLGYERCDARLLESGFQKIAIFVNRHGIPPHAARQLEDGFWTSKLGKCEDIRHHLLEALEDSPTRQSSYGKIALIMKRVRPKS